ncbi:hypothetical protein [Lysinibacillus sp. 54212]|uniref:hypothetical protein n=1 Tax=Lysinibacillus sp. 54212 TaxID=3119829 RepID=UPI002FCB3E2C
MAIISVIIVAFVYIVRIVNRYLANAKIAEQKLKMEETDLQEIKQRLERIEKILSEVE